MIASLLISLLFTKKGTGASQLTIDLAILLTSVCCKLMEYITFLSILGHVNSYNILNMALDQALPANLLNFSTFVVCAGFAFEYIILLIPASMVVFGLHDYHVIFTCLYKVA